MKIQRRDKLKIYGDLLSALSGQNSQEKTVLTRLQVQINVPFDRLKMYISELKGLGLVQGDAELKITDKGRQYLKEYERILDFMKRLGLTY